MFSTVLGLFSQDLAVDPGTSRTRVWLRGSGVVAEESTLVAVHTDARGRRAVAAIGDPVQPMRGRAPAGVELVGPIRDGRIDDYAVAEAFLLHLFRRIHGRNAWMRPRVVVPTPESASPMEVRALRDSCEAAGARDVIVVSRPIAAALGAGLPLDDAHGHLVVDLGAGSSEIALIACNRVVAARTLPGGGRAMDLAIIEDLRRNHDLLIPEATAQRLKHELGAACDAEARASTVKGRCLARGVPRAVEVRADEVCRAIGAGVDGLAAAILDVVRAAPAALASDVQARGVVLTGGGAQLRDLDKVLWRRTGLPVMVAASPIHAVVRGAGRVLEHSEVFRAVAC